MLVLEIHLAVPFKDQAMEAAAAVAAPARTNSVVEATVARVGVSQSAVIARAAAGLTAHAGLVLPVAAAAAGAAAAAAAAAAVIVALVEGAAVIVVLALAAAALAALAALAAAAASLALALAALT